MDIDHHLAKVRQLNAQKHHAHALAIARPLGRMRPGHLELMWQQTVALEGLGRHEEALEACMAVLEKDAARADVWLMRARLLACVDPTRADPESDIAQALQRDPQLAEAHAALAILRHGAGESAAALTAIGRAISLSPDQAGYLTLRATWQEMAAWHPLPGEETVSLHASPPISRRALQSALADYQTLCGLQPDNPRHWLKRARLLELLGELGQARQAHEAGWKLLNPGDPRRVLQPGHSLAPRLPEGAEPAPYPPDHPLAAARLLKNAHDHSVLTDEAHDGAQALKSLGFEALQQWRMNHARKPALSCTAWRARDGEGFATTLHGLPPTGSLLSRLRPSRARRAPILELITPLSSGHFLVSSQAPAGKGMLFPPHILLTSAPGTSFGALYQSHAERLRRFLSDHGSLHILPTREPQELQAALSTLLDQSMRWLPTTGRQETPPPLGSFAAG